MKKIKCNCFHVFTNRSIRKFWSIFAVFISTSVVLSSVFIPTNVYAKSNQSETNVVTTLQQTDTITIRNEEELMNALFDQQYTTLIIDGMLVIHEAIYINYDITFIGKSNNCGFIADKTLQRDVFYLSQQAHVSMQNLTIDGNHTSSGLLSIDECHVTLTDCLLQNVYDDRYESGAIVSYDSDLIIDHTTIRNNETFGTGGGISFSGDHNTLTLRDSIIMNNKAERGGGLSINGNDNTVNVYDSRIDQNIAQYGGGIYTYDADITLFGNSSVNHNQASDNGGGVYWMINASKRKVIQMNDNTMIANNTAIQDGGGIYLEILVGRSISNYEAQLQGVKLNNNQAAHYGGGLYVRSGINVTLKNHMLFDNQALQGDDVYKEQFVSLENKQSYRLYNRQKATATILVDELDNRELDEQVKIPFYGWYEDGGSLQSYKDFENSRRISIENDNLHVLTSSHTATAGLKAIWYGLLLNYDANDGSDNHMFDHQAYLPDTKAMLQDCMFTREGYRFAGWNTQSNGKGVWYDSGKSSIIMKESTVLYAQWVKSVIVHYEWIGKQMPTDVKIPSDDTIDENTSYSSKKQEVSASELVFDGWYVDKACTKKYIDQSVLTNDMTLYGKWTTPDDNEQNVVKPKPSNDKPANSVNTGDNNILAGWQLLLLTAGVVLFTAKNKLKI